MPTVLRAGPLPLLLLQPRGKSAAAHPYRIETNSRPSSGWSRWAWHRTIQLSPKELRRIRSVLRTNARESSPKVYGISAWRWRLGTKPPVADVKLTRDTLSVGRGDGRTITVPLTWYPRLFHATSAQRKNSGIAGGGYGIHWPDIDEDLGAEGAPSGCTRPPPGTGRGLGTQGARRNVRRLWVAAWRQADVFPVIGQASEVAYWEHEKFVTAALMVELDPCPGR